MDTGNYGYSPEVPSVAYENQRLIHNYGYGIPDRAMAIIMRHARQAGVSLDLFLNLKPVGAGRNRVVYARWECWAELRTILNENGKPFYSLPRIGRWFGGLDHTSVLHGLDPERRARAKARYEAESIALGRASRTYSTRTGFPLRVLSGERV